MGNPRSTVHYFSGFSFLYHVEKWKEIESLIGILIGNRHLLKESTVFCNQLRKYTGNLNENQDGRLEMVRMRSNNIQSIGVKEAKVPPLFGHLGSGGVKWIFLYLLADTTTSEAFSNASKADAWSTSSHARPWSVYETSDTTPYKACPPLQAFLDLTQIKRGRPPCRDSHRRCDLDPLLR